MSSVPEPLFSLGNHVLVANENEDEGFVFGRVLGPTAEWLYQLVPRFFNPGIQKGEFLPESQLSLLGSGEPPRWDIGTPLRMPGDSRVGIVDGYDLEVEREEGVFEYTWYYAAPPYSGAHPESAWEEVVFGPLPPPPGVVPVVPIQPDFSELESLVRSEALETRSVLLSAITEMNEGLAPFLSDPLMWILDSDGGLSPEVIAIVSDRPDIDFPTLI